MEDSTKPFLLTDTLGFNLNRLSILFRRNLIRALKEYDLQPEQWQVLASLHGLRGPTSQGELGKITLKDRHSLSKMVDRMEKGGWIKRESHAEDTRINMILMDERAKKEFEGVKFKLMAHFKELLKDFGKQDHDDLLRLICKLLAVIEED